MIMVMMLKKDNCGLFHLHMLKIMNLIYMKEMN